MWAVAIENTSKCRSGERVLEFMFYARRTNLWRRRTRAFADRCPQIAVEWTAEVLLTLMWTLIDRKESAVRFGTSA